MNNQVGFGVMGTFGQPFGYQQEFYHGFSFDRPLDLDENEIEFYAGANLYAVRRELTDGVYTVSFCVYSYVRELNTDRFGTFLGSCVLLRDSFADAEHIYKLLMAVQNDIMANEDNVSGGVLQCEQVMDVEVREPEELVAIRANAIPVSKTPFFSAGVDDGRKILVKPGEATGEESTLVIAFFEEALKHFSDTADMYFSPDSNVWEQVAKNGLLEIMEWPAFVAHKAEQLQSGVVRTKKGIQRPAGMEISSRSYVFASSGDEDVDGTSHGSELIADPAASDVDDTTLGMYPPEDDEDDPYKPFDLWEDDIPDEGLSAAEARRRQREYNRLFNYTNTLHDHMQPAAPKAEKHKAKRTARRERKVAAPAEERPVKKRRGVRMAIIIGIIVVLGGVAVFLLDDGDGKRDKVVAIQAPPHPVTVDSIEAVTDSATVTADSMVATEAPVTQDSAMIADEGKIVPMQPVAKAPVNKPGIDSSGASATMPSASTTSRGTVPDSEKARGPMAAYIPPTTAKGEDQLSVAGLRGKLHPRPNIELTQNDVSALRKGGIKGKTLSEITHMLFTSSPSNIGYIYKGQEAEYAAALLAMNKQIFQRSGKEYVCTADFLVMHIPAYKSPRLPVVFPK